MNRMDFYLENDPREKALRDALYRAIASYTSAPVLQGTATSA